jgi:thioredoxin-related protein
MKYYIIGLCFLFFTLNKSVEATEYYIDLDTAVVQAKENNQHLLVVFSIEDCIYCDKLKEALPSINSLDNYTVCILNSKEYKNIIKQKNIRIYPTSLILDISSNNLTEISRLVGFRSSAVYSEWIKSNYR